MEHTIQPRDLRVGTYHRALLRDASGRTMDAYVANISRRGFRISTNEALSIGDSVSIETEKDDVLPGVIRWALGTEAGGEFLEPARLPDRFGRLSQLPEDWV